MYSYELLSIIICWKSYQNDQIARWSRGLLLGVSGVPSGWSPWSFSARGPTPPRARPQAAREANYGTTRPVVPRARLPANLPFRPVVGVETGRGAIPRDQLAGGPPCETVPPARDTGGSRTTGPPPGGGPIINERSSLNKLNFFSLTELFRPPRPSRQPRNAPCCRSPPLGDNREMHPVVAWHLC